MNSNKIQNKNVATKYMPIKKITKARQLKILDFLKLKQSPFTPSQNKKINKIQLIGGNSIIKN